MYDRYLRYITTPGRYYALPEREVAADAFHLTIPDGWQLATDEDWVSVMPTDGKLQLQGWKIHVSAQPEAAAEVLSLTGDFCFTNRIAFKYTPTVRQLMIKNSKGGNRVACGKFITIYPSEEKLEFTLTSLDEMLSSHRDAPYILSDRRFRSGPLYYRYGGFQRISNSKGELCIFSPDGTLEQDLRVPYYRTPSWVKTPAFLEDNYLSSDQSTNSSDFQGFEIKSALHFSSGGGIYKATKNSEFVILKEGRPFCGLDASGRDAVARIRREASILRALDSVSGVAHFVDEFDVWEHHYLAETFHGPLTFGRWLSLNYPFNSSSSSEQIQEYVSQLDVLVKQLVRTISQLHSLELSHGDIQPHNILVDPDSLSTTVIDFEAAAWDDEPFALSIGTPGYIDSVDDPLKIRDWIGLYRTIRGALLPISPIESLASSKSSEYSDWIEQEFGSGAVSILETVRRAAENDGVDVSSPKSALIDSQIPDFVNQDEARRAIYRSLRAEIDFTSANLAPGDAYQFEGMARRYCLAYGGAGIWKALLDFSDGSFDLSRELNSWLDDLNASLERITKSDFSMGLFTGLAGIVELAMRGDRFELADKLVQLVSNFVHITTPEQFPNISIESGFAGMSLMLSDYYQRTKSDRALDAAEEALRKCKVPESAEQIRFDLDATPTGLLYGWSGVALAAYRLHEVTLDTQYLSLGDEFLQRELERISAQGNLTNLLTDDGRLMPYFSLGSAGVALVVRFREKFGNSPHSFDWAGIIEAMRARPCAHAGLFKGEAGLLGCLIEIDGLQEALHDQITKCAKLYLIQERDTGRLFAPGDFSYRCSMDIATGLAGWLYAINGKLTLLFPGLSGDSTGS